LKFALLITVFSMSVFAQSIARPGAPTGIVLIPNPPVRTCQIPANGLGVPGEGTVIIDLAQKTVSRNGVSQTCLRASFTKVVVDEIIRERELSNQNDVQKKQVSQAQADLDLEGLKKELALVEGTLLIKCVDKELNQERNYFVSLSDKPSHYGYSGETSTRELYDGLVSEMTCR
jgi:hypothetical protein